MSDVRSINSNHNDPSIVSFLNNCRTFSAFSENLIKRISPHFKIQHFPESTEIIKEGQVNSNIYFLVNGKVSVYSNGELILKLRRTGDICGEMSIITKKPCVSSEIAETAVDMYSLDINHIYESDTFEPHELKNLLFHLFSLILVDKLTLASNKAYLYETVNEQLKQSHKMIMETCEEAMIANSVKRNFLESMNHEVRTPMNAIIGLTNLLLEDDLLEKQKEFLQIIENSAQLLLEFFNDILDYSNIETGKVDLVTAPFEIKTMLERVLNEFKVQADSKNLDLLINIDEEVPHVLEGDSTRLYQIMINLTGNAIKFTEAGKVNIIIKQEHCEGDNITLNVSISDTGIGIADNKKERLFKPFSQVDPSSTRKYYGPGLGLVISRQLIEMMDGEIGVESTEGAGSTFWFSLPLKKHLNRRNQDNPPAFQDRRYSQNFDAIRPFSGEQNKNRQILLIENNQIDQIVTLYFLKKQGYQVDIIDSEIKALKILELFPYDMIIMDIELTEISIDEAVKQIRDKNNKSINAEIPIMAISDSDLPNQKLEGLRGLVDDFLVRPIKEKDLAVILQRWLPDDKEN